MSQERSLIDKIKNNWVIQVLIIASIVCTSTWGIANELLVKPRDFRIHELEEQESNLQLNLDDYLEDKHNLEAEIILLRKAINENFTNIEQNSQYEIIANESVIIYPPIWVDEGEIVYACSGQIMIIIDDVDLDPSQVNIAINIQHNSYTRLLKVGERYTFIFNNEMYFLDVLNISYGKALITIIKDNT